MELKEQQILDTFISYMIEHHPDTSMEHMLVIYPKGVIVDFVIAYGKEQYNQALIDAAESAIVKPEAGEENNQWLSDNYLEHFIVDKQSILKLKKH